MNIISLKQIEGEYKQKVKAFFDSGELLNANKLIDLSISLFHEFKVKDVDYEKDKEADMFLFQYGTYNWDDSLGEHFSFDITRQFISSESDEPYQLSFRLIFDPAEFKNCGCYNCWSCDFESLEEWVQHIKTTKGYELAQKQTAKSYLINFDEI